MLTIILISYKTIYYLFWLEKNLLGLQYFEATNRDWKFKLKIRPYNFSKAGLPD